MTTQGKSIQGRRNSEFTSLEIGAFFECLKKGGGTEGVGKG